MNEPEFAYTDSPCPMCGFLLTANLLSKRRERGNMLDMKCRPCFRMTSNNHERRVKSRTTGLICHPWMGDMDYDQMVCLNDEGQPVYLGERICGHADCVNEDHVIVKVPGTWRKGNRGGLKQKRRAEVK